MNLKNKFTKILMNYGYPILIVHQSKKLRCTCWNEKTQEGDKLCPFCFGLGWNPVVEKSMIRGEDLSVPASLTGVDTKDGFGHIHVGNRIWFVSPEVEVTVNDLIVEVDWSETGKPSYTSGGIYEVNHINETLRLEHGRPIFKELYTSDSPIEKRIRGIRIVEVNGIVNYQLAMEGPHV